MIMNIVSIYLPEHIKLFELFIYRLKLLWHKCQVGAELYTHYIYIYITISIFSGAMHFGNMHSSNGIFSLCILTLLFSACAWSHCHSHNAQFENALVTLPFVLYFFLLFASALLCCAPIRQKIQRSDGRTA